MNLSPLSEGVDPPAHKPEVNYLNIRCREEHEAVIRDAKKCEELGLDQYYEKMVYLKRWGGWLNDN